MKTCLLAALITLTPLVVVAQSSTSGSAIENEQLSQQLSPAMKEALRAMEALAAQIHDSDGPPQGSPQAPLGPPVSLCDGPKSADAKWCQSKPDDGKLRTVLSADTSQIVEDRCGVVVITPAVGNEPQTWRRLCDIDAEKAWPAGLLGDHFRYCHDGDVGDHTADPRLSEYYRRAAERQAKCEENEQALRRLARVGADSSRSLMRVDTRDGRVCFAPEDTFRDVVVDLAPFGRGTAKFHLLETEPENMTCLKDDPQSKAPHAKEPQ